MKNNFRTLTSGILTKASTLFPKKEDVYTKNEAVSKEDLNLLTPSDIGAASVEHDHQYMRYRKVDCTLPINADWHLVTYGNGKFVAVADGNNTIAAYSEDGINWTQTTLPTEAHWESVTYGNGKFVAVAYDGDVAAYSEDGINWNKTTLPFSASWYSVTYGNGKFVAVVKYSTIAAYSEDGINWTQTSLPTKAYWQSVTYGNGKFVVIANESTIAAYSEDGINWNKTTLPINADWYSVTYGNGKFVAVAYESTVATYSEDGINWTQTSLPIKVNWTSVTYGNGKFVVIAYSNTVAAYSEDGIDWTQTSLPTKAYWQSVTYGNGKFVVIADDGIAAYSEDGLIWYDEYEEMTQSDVAISLSSADIDHSCVRYMPLLKGLPSIAFWSSVTYGNGKFVVIANESTIAAYSEDGINWNKTTLPINADWYSVTYGNGKFVAVVNDNNNIAAYSEDGIDWTQTSLPTKAYWQSVTYGNGKFVAVASDATLAYSEDGINWTQTSLPTKDRWVLVTYGNGKFVAVADGNNTIAAYSEDGINWTQITLPIKAYWSSVTYGNGKFVAVASVDSTIAAYSEDGINWTQTTLPTEAYWYSVTYGNGKFVVIADDCIAAYSEDGINWTQTSLPTEVNWTSVTYGNGKFVAISYNNTVVAYSKNGITWHLSSSAEFYVNGSVLTPVEMGLATTDKIPTSVSQLTNDAGYITAEDLPTIPEGPVGSTPAIIDVVELPTENIREDCFYRLLTAKLFVYDNMMEYWTCHCVNGLPEVGEAFTVDMSYFILYYNIQDGSVSAYADEALAAQFGLTAGWYPIEMVMQLGESTWGGIVTDINDLDPNDNSLRLLLTYDFYTYKNEWVKTVFASEKAPKVDITWDGDMTGRPALDMSMLGYAQGLYFVKVSDDVFTTDELVGWTYAGRGYDGAVLSRRVDSDMIDTQTYPGAFAINGYIIVVYDADVTASALGIPTGIYTNGVYFWINTDSAEGGYVSNLTSPVRISKIGSEYLDLSKVEDMIDYVVNDVIYGAIGGSY